MRQVKGEKEEFRAPRRDWLSFGIMSIKVSFPALGDKQQFCAKPVRVHERILRTPLPGTQLPNYPTTQPPNLGPWVLGSLGPWVLGSSGPRVLGNRGLPTLCSPTPLCESARVRPVTPRRREASSPDHKRPTVKGPANSPPAARRCRSPSGRACRPNRSAESPDPAGRMGRFDAVPSDRTAPRLICLAPRPRASAPCHW